jgi:hypothetical protein
VPTPHTPAITAWYLRIDITGSYRRGALRTDAGSGARAGRRSPRTARP